MFYDGSIFYNIDIMLMLNKYIHFAVTILRYQFFLLQFVLIVKLLHRFEELFQFKFLWQSLLFTNN